MNRRDSRKKPEPPASSAQSIAAPSCGPFSQSNGNQNNSVAFLSPSTTTSGLSDGRSSPFNLNEPQTSSGTLTPSSLSRRGSSNMSEPISADESDGDDGIYEGKPGLNFRERRREAHTQAEQKRRDAIKKGYRELEEELPSQQESVGSQKPSKALVMQKSIDYVHYLEEQRRKSAEELEELKNDHKGLQIMKQSYEKMAAALRNQPDQGVTPVSDDIKFQVFQMIMENLFETFDARVTADNFAELSGSAFNWLEEWCTPQNFRSITANVLRDTKNNAGNSK